MQLKPITAIIALLFVIVSLLVSGCTTSTTNQTVSAVPSTNASTTISAATTAATTTAATTSPTVTPSPSASPTATPNPSISGNIATSIQFVRDPTIIKGTGNDILGINVISSTSGNLICSLGAVTVLGGDGQTIGMVSSGGSDCFHTAYLDTSNLNPGTYDVILKFAGDSCYKPSQSISTITITA